MIANCAIMESEHHVFLRVVEAGSLNAVAKEMRVEPSTVSRRLVALEQRLGVKLIQRSRVRSTPTEAGTRYYERLRPLLEQLDALEVDIAGTANEPVGHLRVTAPTDFGGRFVTPVLERLQREHPRLTVELILGSSFNDIVAQNIDVAIRIGQLPDSSLLSTKLAEVPRVLVAAPEYLAKRGTPKRPEDLRQHDFIFYSAQNEHAPIVFADPELPTVHMKGCFTVNNVSAIASLVERGVGIHMGPRWAHQEALDGGRLVELLPQFPLRAYPLRAVFAPAVYQPAKLKRFVAAMAEQVRTIPGLRVS